MKMPWIVLAAGLAGTAAAVHAEAVGRITYHTEKDIAYGSGQAADEYRHRQCRLDIYYPEGVRDFAQQIEHVVMGSVSIIGSGVDRPATGLGDSEVYLNSKPELIAFVNRGFDTVGEMLSGMSDADMMADANLFGQATVAKWKLAQTAYEHGVWTLGATVPYVRSEGGAPAGYNLIPGGD